MIAFWIIAAITIFVFGYMLYVGKEGYYIQTSLITVGYWILTVFYYSHSKLMFLTLVLLSIQFTMLSIVTFFKRTSFNRRMVKRYEREGKYQNL